MYGYATSYAKWIKRMVRVINRRVKDNRFNFRIFKDFDHNGNLRSIVFATLDGGKSFYCDWNIPSVQYKMYFAENFVNRYQHINTDEHFLVRAYCDFMAIRVPNGQVKLRDLKPHEFFCYGDTLFEYIGYKCKDETVTGENSRFFCVRRFSDSAIFYLSKEQFKNVLVKLPRFFDNAQFKHEERTIKMYNVFTVEEFNRITYNKYK